MKQISILILALIILALPLVCATSAVEYNGYEGVITPNGEVVYTAVSTLPQTTQQILRVDHNNGWIVAPGTYDIKRYNWYEKYVLGKQNTHFFVSQNSELQLTMNKVNTNGFLDIDFSTGAVILNNIATKQMYNFNSLSTIKGGKGGTATLSIFNIRQSDLDYTYKKIKGRDWEKYNKGEDNTCSKTRDYLICQVDKTLEAVVVIDNNNLNQINDFNVLGYKCKDKTCSELGEQLWDEASTNNKLLINYPENSKNKKYGYGLYFYKQGYIPYEINSFYTGKGATITENIMFTKKQNAHAPIEDLKVQNTAYANMPVMIQVKAGIDSKTYSALRHAGPLQAIPEQLQSFYQVQTLTTLQVSDHLTGQIVYTTQAISDIGFSSSNQIGFEWIPNSGQTGEFDITVSTDIIDEKCDQATKITQYSSKTITILQDNTQQDYCYTILNNLQTSNQFPAENTKIDVYANKISNYVNENEFIMPVATQVTLNMLDSTSTIVYTDTLNLAANQDSYMPELFSFEIDAQLNSGSYTIQLTGICNDQLCNGKTNIQDVLSTGIIVQEPSPSDNHAPTINIPNQVLDISESIQINLNNYIHDSDGDNLQLFIVNKPNPNIVTYNLNNENELILRAVSRGQTSMNIEVSDGEQSNRDLFTITITQDPAENLAPTITSTPSRQAKENNRYLYQITATDPENDILQYSLTESPIGMTINTQTGLIKYTPDEPGAYQVRITVTDGYNNVFQNYNLDVAIEYTKKHLFSLSSELTATNTIAKQGEYFTNYILLRNIGQEPEKHLQVQVSIPEIGFSQQVAKELTLGPQDSKWVPLTFKVPNKKPGTYLFIVEIQNKYYQTHKYGTITIEKSTKTGDKYIFM